MSVKRTVLRFGVIVFALTLAFVALVPQGAHADSPSVISAQYTSASRLSTNADIGVFATLGTPTAAPNFTPIFSQTVDLNSPVSAAVALRIQNFQARFIDTLMDGNYTYPCPGVYRASCVIAPALTVEFDTPEASRPLVMLTVGTPQIVGSPGVPPGPSGTVYPPGAVTTVTAANSTFFYLPKEDAPTMHHVLVLYPRMAPTSFYSGNPVCGDRDPQVPYKAPHCTLTPNQTYWGQTWASIWDDVPSVPTRTPALIKLF